MIKPIQSILFIANARMPTEKAHGVQIAKMCEAFALNDCQTQLVIPHRIQTNSELKDISIFNYYNVKSIFSIKKIPTIDLLWFKPLSKTFPDLTFYLQNLSFAVNSLIFSFHFQGLIFTRSKLFTFLTTFIGKHVIFEDHDSPRAHLINHIIARKTPLIVCITRSIQTDWQQLGAKTLYAPSGVSDEFFKSLSQSFARKRLQIPLNKKICIYTGNFYKWKGVHLILAVASKMPTTRFYLIGGSSSDNNVVPLIEKARPLSNVTIVPHRPYSEIPLWLKAADLLVLPTSGTTSKGRHHTSPLKLFEYMASGTPIVASRLPSTTNILPASAAFFFHPDNVKDLHLQIQTAFTNPAQARRRAQKALKIARSHLWSNRAQSLLKNIYSIQHAV